MALLDSSTRDDRWCTEASEVQRIMSAEEPKFWTPHHIRAAVTVTGTVLLDLKQNRYRGLATETTRALAALAENWSSISTEAQRLATQPRDRALTQAPDFIEAGLLSPAPPEVTFMTRAVNLKTQLTSIGLQERAATSIRAHHLVRFVGACLWARKALRSRSLYSIVCEVSASNTGASKPTDRHRTIELVCIFRRLRPYAFAAQDRCLLHALALLHFLSYYGSRPVWVIGVCARPWAAHSWLQLDDCVLDSSPEEICRFTPILAV
jgi:hypothetical protein